MNIRRTTARRVGEDIGNTGEPCEGNLNALQVQAATNNKGPVNPLALTDCEVWSALFRMAQAIPTHAQSIRSQANKEVVLRENQHASTMASHLRYFIRMNTHMYIR